jgi:diketogulonate reductase-like aldo/keto reductase
VQPLPGRSREHFAQPAGGTSSCGKPGRPGIDAIDLYQIHYQIHWATWNGGPESASPGSIEEAVGALAKLRAEKTIRHIGVSNFNAEQMKRAQKIAPIASLQPLVVASRERN